MQRPATRSRCRSGWAPRPLARHRCCLSHSGRNCCCIVLPVGSGFLSIARAPLGSCLVPLAMNQYTPRCRCRREIVRVGGRGCGPGLCSAVQRPVVRVGGRVLQLLPQARRRNASADKPHFSSHYHLNRREGTTPRARGYSAGPSFDRNSLPEPAPGSSTPSVHPSPCAADCRAGGRRLLGQPPTQPPPCICPELPTASPGICRVIDSLPTLRTKIDPDF